MKEFITYIIKQIVSNPDSVLVEETANGDNFLYTISVADEDMGVVIGKSGHNINSIRDLVRAKAIKDGVYVKVVLKDNRKEEANEETASEEMSLPEEDEMSTVDLDSMTDENQG